MTIIEAITILEIATVECRSKDVDSPKVNQALSVVELYVRPEWVVPQFRSHVLNRHNRNEVDGEGQQQVLRATFPGIRDSVKELIGKQTDALARRFAVSQDTRVGEEIERMATEYGKLGEPWVFVERPGSRPTSAQF